jgi:hypothetical protein
VWAGGPQAQLQVHGVVVQYVEFYIHISMNRDFGIEINVPKECTEKFLTSVIMGTLDIRVFNEFTNVLICALPKSGSMYVWELLSQSLDYDKHEIGFNYGGGKFYYPRMLAAKFTGTNTISHCHEMPIADLMNIVNALDLKLIVHTRNLLDALVSRYDRELASLQEGLMRNIVAKRDVGDFLAAGIEQQLDTIVEQCAKDCINFYNRWDNYEGEVLRTTYEEMLDDEVGLVKKVADWLGCEIGDVEKISNEIKEAGGINFNKGINGRGKKMFSDRQKEEIRHKAEILGCTNEKFDRQKEEIRHKAEILGCTNEKFLGGCNGEI